MEFLRFRRGFQLFGRWDALEGAVRARVQKERRNVDRRPKGMGEIVDFTTGDGFDYVGIVLKRENVGSVFGVSLEFRLVLYEVGSA